MTVLPKSELLNRIQAAIVESGWHTFVERPTHPFKLLVGMEGQSRRLLVYVWNVTSGGPASVRPEGEFRIQITGVDSITQESGYQTLLLGWYDNLRVFVAFDFTRHQQIGKSPSVQVRSNILEQANTLGIAFHTRSSGDIAVVFSSEQFMSYVLNQDRFHSFSGNREEIDILAAAREEEIPAEEMAALPRERREAVVLVRQLVRERDFRSRVLIAYQRHCAVCHMQLGIVQAAHIVPVHIPGSTDVTRNGLALCPTHHTAYDNGLVGVRSNYQIAVNEDKLTDIRSQNMHMGEDQLKNYVDRTIWLPQRPNDRPSPDLLSQGLQVRGWGVWAGS